MGARARETQDTEGNGDQGMISTRFVTRFLTNDDEGITVLGPDDFDQPTAERHRDPGVHPSDTRIEIPAMETPLRNAPQRLAAPRNATQRLNDVLADTLAAFARKK